MSRAAILVLLGLGCGSSQSVRTAPPPSNQGSGGSAVASIDPDALCRRARALRDEGCAPYDRVAPSILDDCTIVDGIYMAGMEACLREDTCDRVQACSGEARRAGAPYGGPTAPCEDPPRPTIPAGVSAAELAQSYGRDDRRYSDSPSSKERPIEVCGLPAEGTYLLRLTCDDGSRPFADADAAARARAGNVGEGGRCGRVIDHYEVPCPERTYDVFIDPYRCPA